MSEVSTDPNRPQFPGADMLRMALVRAGGLENLIFETTTRAFAEPAIEDLHKLAWAVTPYDADQGISDEARECGRRFHEGLVLGTLLFDNYPGGYSAALRKLRLQTPSGLLTDNPVIYRRALGVSVMHKANAGIRQGGDHAAALTALRAQVAEDLEEQDFFVSGFGLMLAIMQDIRTEQFLISINEGSLEELADQVASDDFDWDAATRDLL